MLSSTSAPALLWYCSIASFQAAIKRSQKPRSWSSFTTGALYSTCSRFQRAFRAERTAASLIGSYGTERPEVWLLIFLVSFWRPFFAAEPMWRYLVSAAFAALLIRKGKATDLHSWKSHLWRSVSVPWRLVLSLPAVVQLHTIGWVYSWRGLRNLLEAALIYRFRGLVSSAPPRFLFQLPTGLQQPSSSRTDFIANRHFALACSREEVLSGSCAAYRKVVALDNTGVYLDAANFPAAYVLDPASGLVFAYAVPSDLLNLLAHLRPGEPLSVRLDDPVLLSLLEARIVVEPDWEQQRLAEFERWKATGRSVFKERGWLYTPSIMPEHVMRAMADRYRAQNPYEDGLYSLLYLDPCKRSLYRHPPD